MEFVGLPGAGKSALSRQVAVLLQAQGLVVSEPTDRLNQISLASRTLTKVGYGIGAAAAAPLTSARWLRIFGRTGQRSLADTGRVALNWFFLVGLIRGLTRRPGVHLLDQGIFQGLWSVGYAARDEAVAGREIDSAVLTALPPRILVIVVETSPDTLRRRLHQRPGGDSRLERDLATSESAGSLTRATATFAGLQALLDRLGRQEAIALMRVQGEHPEQLQATAQAVAERIMSIHSPCA